MTNTAANQALTKRPRKMARWPKSAVNEPQMPKGSETAASAQPAPNLGKPQTKSALVLDLLLRPDGATIDQLVAATGWLPHTIRAALTGFKKKGHVITSEKLAGGTRAYRIIAKAVAAQ